MKDKLNAINVGLDLKASVSAGCSDEDGQYDTVCLDQVTRGDLTSSISRNNESLLEDNLYWLDEGELKLVLECLLAFKRDLDMFISDLNLNRMMDEFKECSLYVLEECYRHKENYDQCVKYIENNWDCCFEYLTRETIIYIICKYVDKDPVMLASMVKAFKYSDIRTASKLTCFAAHIKETYGFDIFNPIITNADKIHWEENSAKYSKAFLRNKIGSFMMQI
jgi:hypothetical protein